jgi:hypothetical protein
MAYEDDFLNTYATERYMADQLRDQSPVERFRNAVVAIAELIAYSREETRIVDVSEEVQAEFSYLAEFGPRVPGHTDIVLPGLAVAVIKDGNRFSTGRLSQDVDFRTVRGSYAGYKGAIYYSKTGDNLDNTAHTTNFRSPDEINLKNLNFKAAIISTQGAYKKLSHQD